MTVPPHLARHYQQNKVATASPEKIVLMLFDGAVKFAKQAQLRMKEGDVPGTGESLSKIQAIVSELNSSLDREQETDVVGKLASLYSFVVQQVVTANISRDPADLDVVIRILNEIKAGFEGAINGSSN